MKKANAAVGLKWMFYAEAVTILCMILDRLPVVWVVGSIGFVVCLIVDLLGLNRAGKDIPGCKTAFNLTIAELVITILNAIFGGIIISAIFNVVIWVLQLLIIYNICTSVAGTVEKFAPSLAATGQRVWKLVVGCKIVTIVIQILSVIPILGTILAVLLTVIIVIVEIIAEIMFLVFLYRSSKVLE